MSKLNKSQKQSIDVNDDELSIAQSRNINFLREFVEENNSNSAFNIANVNILSVFAYDFIQILNHISLTRILKELESKTQ